MATQPSSYEQAKLYRQQLQQAKEEELAKVAKAKTKSKQDFAQEPDKLADETAAQRRWEQDRQQAKIKQIRQTAKQAGRQKIKKAAGKAARKAAKSLIKKAIIPILTAIGGALVTAGPWILASLAVLIVLALAFAAFCELPESFRIALQFIGTIRGIECGD